MLRLKEVLEDSVIRTTRNVRYGEYGTNILTISGQLKILMSMGWARNHEHPGTECMLVWTSYVQKL